MKTSDTLDTQNHDWPKLLATWKRSNLSGAEFCKRRGLIYHQFVYWKRKLCKPASSSTHPKQGSFIKVKSLPAVTATEGLTITLPGGILIEGVNEANVGLLRGILEQL
ncbi:MAG: IS66 family insertion sequence element accessory protein TnpB [Pseudomonadota bacterium]|nr:IS66 family insertion sequence element accessory protein TnpB [Pseudomonadota bacterium]